MSPGERVYWLRRTEILCVVFDGARHERAAVLRRQAGYAEMVRVFARREDLCDTPTEALALFARRKRSRIAELQRQIDALRTAGEPRIRDVTGGER